MRLITFFGLIAAAFCQDVTESLNSTEIPEISEINRETYCNLVKNTNFVRNHSEGEHLRVAQSNEIITTFPLRKLRDNWRELLKDRFDYKCDAQQLYPRREGELMKFPEFSCHDICRMCFQDSLPICLRRNINNNFGLTCFCSYNRRDPIQNYAFRKTD